MKKLFLLASVIVPATLSMTLAAPVVKPSEVSEETLKGIATERQKASMEAHEKAQAKVKEEREKAIKEAKEITEKNDSGLKKTIQKRHLNSMLPPCEREPEAPREPGDYRIRY